ncbi:hypothetical protein CF327_g3977 [Tilletia walkeri]|uniref:Uncharacterized protein n=1 Tax=Tilletia walkeri TaxID=117179 RepID=A0A8X7T4H7_9BASI|nr:hypothetical protein CF327_g3977 [Tilletia walkeri]KAE8268572.1 hypothetical protein A4X09_0g3759 [Tilletia walkeri]
MNSNSTNINAGTNVTVAQGCARLASNTNFTLTDLGAQLYDSVRSANDFDNREPFLSPSVFDRMCGYHGALELDNLSRCCPNATLIETTSQFGGKCGVSCPYNGTVADWKTCLAADDSVEVFCLKVVKRKSSAGARRVRQSGRTSFGWTLVVVGLTVLAMLVPAASAAPPSKRAVDWSHGRQVCLNSRILEGPYLATDVDVADIPNFTQRVEVTTGAQVVTSQTVNLSDRAITTIPIDTDGLTSLFCHDTLLPGARFGYCGSTNDLETSYEVWAPNNTVVEFTLKPAYVCIKARIFNCLKAPYTDNTRYPETFTGLYCITRTAEMVNPLAFWSVSQTPLS